MRLSLSTHLFVYNPLGAQALQAMAESPLSSLEVWLASPHLPWRDQAAMGAFRADLAAHGLSASSVHLPLYPSVPELLEQNIRWSLIDPDPVKRQAALEGTADGLRAAGVLGAGQAVLHMGWPADQWDAESHRLARQSMEQLLPIAAENQVVIALENLTSAGTSVEALMTLLDQVQAGQWGGICLDVGHANLEGDVVEILRRSAPRLSHLHLHDNDGTGDQHRPPGDGNLDWPAIYQVLEELEFHGHGAIEIRDYSKGETLASELLHQSLQAASQAMPNLPLYPLTTA
jgi:sugar phosphate isomerase/epimerase